MATDPVALTARARFRAHLETLVQRHPELSAGELADLVGQTLPDSDRELVEEFLSAEARNILAWEMRAQFSRTRQGVYRVLDLANPDAPAIDDLDEGKKVSLFDRISQWREFVPSESPCLSFPGLAAPRLLISHGLTFHDECFTALHLLGERCG
jgi:hypothetical protein